MSLKQLHFCSIFDKSCMKLFIISVTFLTLFVTSLEGLKCHGLVKNFGNYSKFHTDTGEVCTSLSQYCFSVNGIVDTVKNVYIAGCDELLTEPDFKNLLLKCTGNTTTKVDTASNKYAFTCCGNDMCNSSYTSKISLGFLLYSLDCLVCEKYFSGIPLVKKSALEETNITCSSPDAYCVNTTVKFIKWHFVARSCSDDASVIKKIHKDFNGICTNNTCSNFNFPLDIEGSVCCCKNDYCNGSPTLFNVQLFFNLLLLILVILYFN